MKQLSSEVVIKKDTKRKARIEALNYLVLWSQAQQKTDTNSIKEEEDPHWKFNKTRQVWLIKNCYSIERMPAKHFKIYLKYLKTVKGGQSR